MAGPKRAALIVAEKIGTLPSARQGRVKHPAKGSLNRYAGAHSSGWTWALAPRVEIELS